MNYPDDSELDQIRNWPYQDPLGWFRFIKSVGKYWPDEDNAWRGWREEEVLSGGFDQAAFMEIGIATGGWSGNERILAAMQDNAALWLFTWESSRRGGHYTFRIRTK